MNKTRLEAFSDGVIAILITVLVLELKVPQGASLEALRPVFPVFLTYVLSFIYLGIYWNNHHHMLHLATHINGKIMWANLHLLFWLSLIPFMTGWMGGNHFEAVPTAFYGGVLFMSGVAYMILQSEIIAAEGPHSKLAQAVTTDWKGKASSLLYAIAIGMAFIATWVSHVIYILLAAIWFIPDRRIERLTKNRSN